MAVNMHIKIATIDGSSPVEGFKDQIQIESFSWGMRQSTSFGRSGGGTSGKVEVGDLNIVHVVDKATPKLMQACCLGKHLDSAVLTCRKAGGESNVDFLTIKLTDVLISSVQPSGTAHGDLPMESVTLAFAAFEVKYQEQDNKGAKKGGEVVAGFNMQENKKM